MSYDSRGHNDHILAAAFEFIDHTLPFFDLSDEDSDLLHDEAPEHCGTATRGSTNRVKSILSPIGPRVPFPIEEIFPEEHSRSELGGPLQHPHADIGREGRTAHSSQLKMTGGRRTDCSRRIPGATSSLTRPASRNLRHQALPTLTARNSRSESNGFPQNQASTRRQQTR